jgi:hypothetical protein
MIGTRPPRPTGNSREAIFMQAVWDKLWGAGSPELRVNDVSGQRTQRTTRGTFTIAPPGGKPAPGSQCPY